jgi:glutathione S-transferase
MTYDKALAGKTYLVGEEYTVADMMCYPWFRQLQTGYKVGHIYHMYHTNRHNYTPYTD